MRSIIRLILMPGLLVTPSLVPADLWADELRGLDAAWRASRLVESRPPESSISKVGVSSDTTQFARGGAGAISWCAGPTTGGNTVPKTNPGFGGPPSCGGPTTNGIPGTEDRPGFGLADTYMSWQRWDSTDERAHSAIARSGFGAYAYVSRQRWPQSARVRHFPEPSDDGWQHPRRRADGAPIASRGMLPGYGDNGR